VRRTSRGAALIAAMLTVTLVALLAAGAQWQQWQQTEIESAARKRQQATWILAGALDWSRLVLREDARSNSVDHLAEPWALPLRDARLGTFLGVDEASSDDTGMLDAALSGQITDAQAKLNFANLVQNNRVSSADLQDFVRLFDMLHLPEQEITQAAENYRDAVDVTLDPSVNSQAIAPVRWAQLANVGLSAETLARIEPFVTLLPERTRLNLNTASPEVMRASIAGLDSVDAQRLVQLREQAHFKTLGQIMQAMPSIAQRVEESRHSVASQYFGITGRLRLDRSVVQEQSLVVREGSQVRVLWRSRNVTPTS
jgi:general secretion pathway protein K